MNMIIKNRRSPLQSSIKRMKMIEYRRNQVSPNRIYQEKKKLFKNYISLMRLNKICNKNVKNENKKLQVNFPELSNSCIKNVITLKSLYQVKNMRNLVAIKKNTVLKKRINPYQSMSSTRQSVISFLKATSGITSKVTSHLKAINIYKQYFENNQLGMRGKNAQSQIFVSNPL